MKFPNGGDIDSVREAYGDPRRHEDEHGVFDERAWRAEIMSPDPVYFPTPVKLSGSAPNAKPVMVTKVFPHRLIAEELLGVLQELSARGAWRHIHDYAGCYSYRLRRGGASLSLHSWAVALDFNANRYPLGVKPDPTDPFVTEVVPVFERRGWTWGGRWNRPDVMHVQATRGA